MFASNYNALPEQCKSCQHLKVYSLRMDGNHSYSCTRYPRKPDEENCPEYIAEMELIRKR